MARFSLSRPSTFFRRNTSASAKSSHTAATSGSTLDTLPESTPVPGHFPDSPPSTAISRQEGLPLHAPQPKKSAAALGDQLPDQGVEAPGLILPQKENAFLAQELELQVQTPLSQNDGDDHSIRRSGSETLAPTSLLGDGGDKSPSVVSTREVDLKLGELEEQTRLSSPPVVTLEQPTPTAAEAGIDTCSDGKPDIAAERRSEHDELPVEERRTLAPSTAASPSEQYSLDEPRERNLQSAPPSRDVSPHTRPADPTLQRRPSIVDSANAGRIVNTLVTTPGFRFPHRQQDSQNTISTGLPTSAVAADYFTPGLPNIASMLHRKIWVRRPGQSATLVQIREDDLVDDVRDMILKKYANSLGRTFDAPDMTLRIVQRGESGNGQQQRSERVLGPEEEMCRTIDHYYSGGQTVEDAIVIDVPIREKRQTPRPSPGARAYQQSSYHQLDDYRPMENGTDYFPPMPPTIVHPSMTNTHHPSIAGPLEPHQRSMSVLNTGQLPPLPSPGGTRRGMHSRENGNRPKYQRQHTSSPTILSHPSQTQTAQQQAYTHAVNSASAAAGLPPGSQFLSGQQPQNNPMNVNPAHPLVHRPSNRPRNDSLASDATHHGGPNGVASGVPSAAGSNGGIPQPPTPPAPDQLAPGGSTPPTPQGKTPGALRTSRPGRKARKPTPEKPTSGSRHRREASQTANNADGTRTGTPNNNNMSSPLPAYTSLLDASVPPINVLIVEDNIINLRILEGLMKRLKVRWQTAMNGQIAVDKWRGGGYHLVLMDIQMPVMNGLQATKEIRRLERVNGIGVFSDIQEEGDSSPVNNQGKGNVIDGEVDGEAALERTNTKKEADKLVLNEGLFKSPVIIVALTASSLQSDRHEALAAGCNDFLTKPVNFVWLERKVKEWGCMQALIDFDGWRRWKDYAAKEEEGKSAEQREEERRKEEKEKTKMEKLAKLQEKQRLKKEEEERKKKRQSLNVSEAGTAATTSSAGGVVAGNGYGVNGGSASEA